MRTLWSGSLSFGLINIPIKLYSASEEHALSFDMLHKKDLSPIRFARICKADGKEVPYSEIVKGYEYKKDEYIVVEEADFKQASPEKSDQIEIVNFAHESEIDTVYYHKPYYLEPGKGADKSYALLRETLKKSEKVGIVRYVFRNLGHLGIIKPYGDAIILVQLRFANELRSMEDLKLPPEKEINKKEVDMALKLVNQLTEEFNIKDYHDTYHEKLEKVIKDKLKGVKPSTKSTAVSKPSKVHDIMALLKASLEEDKHTQKAEKPAPKKKRA